MSVATDQAPPGKPPDSAKARSSAPGPHDNTGLATDILPYPSEPVGLVMPESVRQAFMDPKRSGDLPSPYLGPDSVAAQWVACVLVTHGWTTDEIVGEIERREAEHVARALAAHDWQACGRTFVCEHCQNLWHWRVRRTLIANTVALAQYRVTGETPADNLYVAHQAIAENPAVTGPAILSRADLDSFLTTWVTAGVQHASGRTANSDRALIEAFASISSRAGTLVVAPGDRRLGETADLSHPTTWRARLRLEAAGLIRLHRSASAFEAAAYVLTCPTSLIANPLVLTCKSPSQGDLINKWVNDGTCHPAFHSLGKSQRFMVAALNVAGRPLGAEEWWRASGVKRATFYRNLEKLKACEVPLVVETESGYMPHPDQAESLDLLAEYTGATKAVEARKVGHDLERQGHRWFYTWRTVKLALRHDEDAMAAFQRRFEIQPDQRAADLATGEVLPVAEALEAFGVESAQTALVVSLAPEPLPARTGGESGTQPPSQRSSREVSVWAA